MAAYSQATGVTTFVQLPSSRAISVATSIAYPHTITPEQRKQVLGSAGVSINGLANVEKRFVHQITKIGGEVSQSNLGQCHLVCDSLRAISCATR